MKAYGIWVGQGPELGSWAIDLVEVPARADSHTFEGKFVSEITAGGQAPTVFKKGSKIGWENYHNLVKTLEEAYKETLRQLWK
jgi:hypothetical protein